jgi:hypothetical protein
MKTISIVLKLLSFVGCLFIVIYIQLLHLIFFTLGVILMENLTTFMSVWFNSVWLFICTRYFFEQYGRLTIYICIEPTANTFPH